MSVAIASPRKPTLPELPDLRNYDLGRALRRAAADLRLDGLEAEVSRELERATGRSAGMLAGKASARGPSFLVPLLAPVGIEWRDLTVSTGSGAVGAVTDITRLVDLLRARSLVLSSGAVLVDSMSGSSYNLPKFSAGSVVHWVSESNAPAETNPQIGSVTFDPHSLAAHVDVSRKMSIQADGPRIAIRDITRAMGAELDRVALNGSGSGAEPEGLISNTSIPVVSLGAAGGAMTRAAAIAMERSLADAGADAGPLAWLGTPAARAAMRAIELSSGSGKYLWSDEDTILSHPARATGNLPNDLTEGAGEDLSALILANREDLIIGTWGAVDFTIDRFSLGTAGGIRVYAFWDVDVNPRNVESFVIAKDIDVTP